MVSDEQEMHEKPHHILDWVTDSVDLWALDSWIHKKCHLMKVQSNKWISGLGPVLVFDA